MILTPTIGLSKYELTDAANLADGYNTSMDILDRLGAAMMARFPIKSDDIADRAVTSSKLNNGSVTTDKIVDANVTNSKLASDSVTTDKIMSSAITNEKLAQNSVGTANIMNGSVDNNKLYDKSVTTNKLADGCVTTNKLADECVTTNNLADGCVTAAKLAEGSISIDNIPDGAITDDKIANHTISKDKLNPKKIIVFIGDSYAVGWTPDGTITGLVQSLQSRLPLFTIVNVSAGGAGFKNGTFNSQLTSAIDKISVNDRQYVEKVIFAGGYNDHVETSSQETINNIASAALEVSSTFSNATMSLAFIGNIREHASTGVHAPNTKKSVLNAYKDWKSGAKQSNVVLLTNMFNCLFRNDFFASDGVHPNSNGVRQLVYMLAPYISDGTLVEANGAVALATNPGLTCVKRGNNTFIQQTSYSNPLNKTFDTNISVKCDGKTPIEVSSNFTDAILNPDYKGTAVAIVRARVNESSIWKTLFGMCSYSSSKFEFYPFVASDDTGGYLELTINHIQLYSVSMQDVSNYDA